MSAVVALRRGWVWRSWHPAGLSILFTLAAWYAPAGWRWTMAERLAEPLLTVSVLLIGFVAADAALLGNVRDAVSQRILSSKYRSTIRKDFASALWGAFVLLGLSIILIGNYDLLPTEGLRFTFVAWCGATVFALLSTRRVLALSLALLFPDSPNSVSDRPTSKDSTKRTG